MYQILNIVKQYLLSKAGSAAIGFMVFLALIWFGGPYLGIRSVAVRLAIILAIVALVCVYWGAKWLIARRRGKNFKKELQSQEGEDESKLAEIKALQEKMDEAVSALKTSGLGVKYRGSSALYALPWYMIIGPSAAGKSTLLRNSGLHFPYSHSDDIDIKGFGGTRNCDWWFSDEAVILDTAGRYTTEENGHDEWVAFLSLLKKYRRRMPINGIIVAISISDILTADEDVLEWHVKVIRERIEELISNLGFLFPIYIIFTKADLLKGFQSYFGDLSENERNQVWGTFITEFKQDDDAAGIIADKLDDLYKKLCELRLRKLAMQRKHEIKSEIYDFPSQFQAASEKLIEFISLLFKENPYQENPNFKGVYFTSGTQEGLPLQRVVGNLRQAFGYVEKENAEIRKEEKSYFINRLLRDVVFKLSGNIGKNKKNTIITNWAKSAAILTGVSVVVISVLLLSATFTNNTLLLNKGVSVVEEMRDIVANDRASSAEKYVALANIYAHYVKVKEYTKDKPWYLRLGVFRADEQLAPIEKLIISSMKENFLKPVALLLETSMRDYSQRWDKVDKEDEAAKLRQDYYDALKVYLMIGMPQRIVAEEALPLLYASWKAVMAPSDNSLSRQKIDKIPPEHIKGMISLYLRNIQLPSSNSRVAEVWHINDSLVETARNILRTPPNADLLYAQLRNKGKAILKHKNIRDLLKGRGSSFVASNYKLPVVFTRVGWENYVSREIKTVVNSASRGDWVLGTEKVILAQDSENTSSNEGIDVRLFNQLEQQIRKLYFDEYVNTWFEFLAALRIKKFNSVSDAANKLLLISRPDGPIAEILSIVNENINLTEVEWKDGRPNRRDNTILTTTALIKELDTHFNDLRRFTRPAEKHQVSELINQYLLSLSTLQSELERLRASSELPRDAEIFATNMLSGSGGGTEMYKSWVTTTGLLNGTDVRTRRSIEPLLISAIKNSWQAVLTTAMQDVQQKWQNMVVREYDERIRGRFPFSRNGPDAALDDVTEFFRPRDGILWSFIDNHLSTYLVKRRSVWIERKWLDIGPGFSKEYLAALKRAKNITKGLFRRNSDDPNVVFYLYPVPTSGLSEVLLESNGQMYRYRNEPQEWRKFDWPGNKERTGARIIGVSDRNNVRGEIKSDGIWGLFHVFRKAKMVKERGTQYLSTWKIESVNGKPINVSFRLKADRHNNLFKPGLLNGFRLPEKINHKENSGTKIARRSE